MDEANYALEDLREAYASADGLSLPLNASFRQALRAYAESQSLQFSQDTAGNIYITWVGEDPELAPIAVSFPLDGGLSESTFVSAFRIFSNLSRGKTMSCGLVLLGWTSLGSELVGREIWEGPVSKSLPELDQFRTMRNPQDASVSAIFDVSEEEAGTKLRVEGSPVLVDKACIIPSAASADIRQSKPARAPMVSIKGPQANSAACNMIRSYSTYVVALFDNFD